MYFPMEIETDLQNIARNWLAPSEDVFLNVLVNGKPPKLISLHFGQW